MDDLLKVKGSSTETVGYNGKVENDQKIAGNAAKKDLKMLAVKSGDKQIVKKAQKENTPLIKSPLAQLNELKPDVEYTLVSETGLPTSPIFTVSVRVDAKIFQGTGSSKQKAKQAAAAAALSSTELLSTKTETPKSSSTGKTCDQRSSRPLPPCTPLGKSPVSILYEIRPGCQFEFSQQTEAPKPHPQGQPLASEGQGEESILHQAQVIVDGRTFASVGKTKQQAKAKAAQQALEQLFNLPFFIAPDETPYFVDDPRHYIHLRHRGIGPRRQPGSACQSKNPVQEIHEFFPDVQFLQSSESDDNPGVYHVTFDLEGVTFEGTGSSVKGAKVAAAQRAIDSLQKSGRLEVMRSKAEEKRKAKSARIREIIRRQKDVYRMIPGEFRPQRFRQGMWNVRNSIQYRTTGPPHVPPIPLKNAVVKLNDHFMGLEYQLISPSCNPNHALGSQFQNPYYVMSVRVRGQTFGGGGPTKKLAKAEAAEQALKWLGLWTEQDSAIRDLYKAQCEEKAQDHRSTGYHAVGQLRGMHPPMMGQASYRGGYQQRIIGGVDGYPSGRATKNSSLLSRDNLNYRWTTAVVSKATNEGGVNNTVNQMSQEHVTSEISVNQSGLGGVASNSRSGLFQGHNIPPPGVKNGTYATTKRRDVANTGGISTMAFSAKAQSPGSSLSHDTRSGYLIGSGELGGGAYYPGRYAEYAPNWAPNTPSTSYGQTNYGMGTYVAHGAYGGMRGYQGTEQWAQVLHS